mgnify:CR=1 FL=1
MVKTFGPQLDDPPQRTVEAFFLVQVSFLLYSFLSVFLLSFLTSRRQPSALSLALDFSAVTLLSFFSSPFQPSSPFFYIASEN